MSRRWRATRIAASGPGLLCLAVLLSGCAATCPPVEPMRISPPAEWTEPVPEPEPDVSDNESLLDYIDALREALDKANSKLEAIRQWQQSD